MIDRIKVSASEVPVRIKTLLTEMLDFDYPRNRPTIFDVISEIAGSLDDWGTEAETDRFIVAYMADHMIDYFHHRGWIDHKDRNFTDEVPVRNSRTCSIVLIWVSFMMVCIPLS
uniref:Uncharacterized protein n=1 Tax=Candidatus Kentrum sp. LPFa TaxID=2126335 RepID=A0A450W709_9GAMM|nr:MAG: hypothetical protein BECKLPF1236A_GA0070988_100776 [Candidatus Kentron sp. LPFa]VFK30602.1 MAG: hypothetical protein BECKLPF1236C_GA0070990_101156 [Candidatus Kentron sp. LPFa]